MIAFATIDKLHIVLALVSRSIQGEFRFLDDRTVVFRLSLSVCLT